MTWRDEHGNEIELRSGALPGATWEEQEEWLQRDFPGYVPGGADRMAERILAEPEIGRKEEPPWDSGRKRKAGGLPQGYGDADNRGGHDPGTGR